MRCLNCNLTVPDGTKECPVCNAKISHKYRRCDSCFIKLSISENVCPKCGCDLTVNRDDDFVHYDDEHKPKFRISMIGNFLLFAASVILVIVLVYIAVK